MKTLAWIAVFLISCSLAVAEPEGKKEREVNKEEESRIRDQAELLVGIAYLSWFASEFPTLMGGVYALSPLKGFHRPDFPGDDPANYAAITATSSYGLYYALELSKAKYSKSDRFKVNMAFMYTALLISDISDGLSEQKSTKLQFFAIPKGAMFTVNYRF